jgi:hypothetical protein
VFKEKPFISRPISSLLTLRKTGAFSFSTPLCTIRPYTARPSCKIIEHEKCTRTKPQHRCFNATIQHPVLVQPRNLAYQKAILQNLEFIADSEALLKISDKKAYQITLLKITAHENCVALSNHFINH